MFVRKKPKDHGAKLSVEGLAKGETLAGKRVVVVEDVTTTGGSALKAVEAVRDAGGEIALVLDHGRSRGRRRRNLQAGGAAVPHAVHGEGISGEGLKFPLPLVGRVRGGVADEGARCEAGLFKTTIPLPDPPPQGGRANATR